MTEDRMKPCHCPSGPRGVSESESIVTHLTEVADELLDFARLHPEAYDELCEAAAQIVEAKRRIAKRQVLAVETGSTCG